MLPNRKFTQIDTHLMLYDPDAFNFPRGNIWFDGDYEVRYYMPIESKLLNIERIML